MVVNILGGPALLSGGQGTRPRRQRLKPFAPLIIGMIPRLPSDRIPSEPRIPQPPLPQPSGGPLTTPLSPMWVMLKEELEALRREVSALGKKLEALEGRVSSLEGGMEGRG